MSSSTAPLPLGYRPAAAGRLIGCGKTMVFKLIREGRLEAVKLGAATIIPRDSIERLMNSLPKIKPQPA
jgi:excisionase family DNA binding protein